MFILFTVLIVITCILIILIVLVQNSKGGGLASNFSSSNQYMGVRKTADFLEKATWSLGSALILFSLLAGITIPKHEEEVSSRLAGQFDESIMENPPSTIDLPESFDIEPQGN
ncbi:MAG TPA: preprotein translocase subunit SecG [Bacteroidaceae bacterium]|nr:preprotein translocase subunit SecG [Bacteroidaceae bacterium]